MSVPQARERAVGLDVVAAEVGGAARGLQRPRSRSASGMNSDWPATQSRARSARALGTAVAVACSWATVAWKAAPRAFSAGALRAARRPRAGAGRRRSSSRACSALAAASCAGAACRRQRLPAWACSAAPSLVSVRLADLERRALALRARPARP